MRKVVITEKNQASVVGMLKKFFDHGVFIGWHTFNGGMKKRIHHHIYTKADPLDDNAKLEIYNTKVVYRGVKTSVNSEGGLDVLFSPGEGETIGIGSEVNFLGNRVILKRKWEHGMSGDNTYLYECYQILSANDDTSDCNEPLDYSDDPGYYDISDYE